MFRQSHGYDILPASVLMRRWRSGQSQQTVNLSPFGLRGFESLPTHQNKTFRLFDGPPQREPI